VYFFAITSASTASALQGAIVMLIFGLSTIPSMFALGFFVGLFKKISFRNNMIKIASIGVLLYGGYTIVNGYGYIIDPNRTLLECH
jgi:sulfite exporter TauE/SafE